MYRKANGLDFIMSLGFYLSAVMMVKLEADKIDGKAPGWEPPFKTPLKANRYNGIIQLSLIP